MAPRTVLECNLIKAMAHKDYGARLAELEQKLNNSASFNTENAKIAQNETKYEEKIIKTAENLQNNQTTDEKPTKNEENLQEAGQKTLKTKANDDEFMVLGELMQYLRQSKATPLVAALGQVKKIIKEDNHIEFVFDDETSVDMLSFSRDKNLIEDFFRAHGLSYSFVSKEKSRAKGNEASNLSKIFGDKLKIDN